MRLTIDDLVGAVDRLGNKDIILKFSRGKPYLWDERTREIISPVLSLRDMFLFLEALEKGIQIGRR